MLEWKAIRQSVLKLYHMLPGCRIVRYVSTVLLIIMLICLLGIITYFILLLLFKVFTKEEISLLPKLKPRKTKMIL